MLKVPGGEFGAMSPSSVHYILLDWLRYMMATDDLVLLWSLFGAETQGQGFIKTDHARSSSLSKRRHRIYQVTRKRLPNEVSPTLSFAAGLGAASVFEKRLGNYEASETHRRALVAILSPESLSARASHPLWRCTIVNKFVEIGARELYIRCTGFPDKILQWREQIEKFQQHFTLRAAVNQAMTSPSSSVDVTRLGLECPSRDQLAGLFTVVNALYTWRNHPRAVSEFSKELLLASKKDPSLWTLSEIICSGEIPSFVLTHLSVHLVEKRQRVEAQHHIDPAKALEFLELTMMLGQENIGLIVAALFSWLRTDEDACVYLDEGMLDEMMLEIIAVRHDDLRHH
jgi:hypothetical protein